MVISNKGAISLLSVVVLQSGLRRWFKDPVSSEAWVRIPSLPVTIIILIYIASFALIHFCTNIKLELL